MSETFHDASFICADIFMKKERMGGLEGGDDPGGGAPPGKMISTPFSSTRRGESPP